MDWPKGTTGAQKRRSLSGYGCGAARVRMAFGGVEVVRLDGEWRTQQHGRAFCLGVGWTGTHPAENRVATRIRVATRFRVVIPGCGPLDAESTEREYRTHAGRKDQGSFLTAAALF